VSGTAELYRRFAWVQARGESRIYERLALAVADDAAAVELLEVVDLPRRQPNLLFGALRWHHAPVEEPRACLRWLHTHPEPVLQILRARRTQTNEAGRCAVLLPALAVLPQPLALLEVGASAGLCLLPDRWRYHYVGDRVDRWIGRADSPVVLRCVATGPVPIPPVLPTIVWRRGLDLDPVDVTDPVARRWLRCLVWPEHQDRARRLDAALRIAAEVSPRVERGHLVGDLPRVLARVPRDTIVVVQHSATLTYLEPAERRAFRELVRQHGAHLVGCEGVDVLPDLADQLPGNIDTTGQMLLSVDDRVLAVAHPHGRSLTWLE
jgi:hypothetical protein